MTTRRRPSSRRHDFDLTAPCHDDSTEARLGDLIDPQPNGCWLYKGSTDDQGRGFTKVAGQRVYVHRYIYETLCAPLPPTYILRSTCGANGCCNPDHRTVEARAR